MAKLSKQEVAAKCDWSTRALSVYISRGKMNVNESGDIDDADLKNRAFIERRIRKLALKGKNPNTGKEITDTEPEKPEKKESQASVSNPNDMEYQKLVLQVEKLRNENEKLRLANEKTIGSFITIEPIKLLIMRLSETIHAANNNENDDFILKFGAKYGLSREEITEAKKLKWERSNYARGLAITEAKKELKKLQAQVADQRMRGEHD